MAQWAVMVRPLVSTKLSSSPSLKQKHALRAIDTYHRPRDVGSRPVVLALAGSASAMGGAFALAIPTDAPVWDRPRYLPEFYFRPLHCTHRPDFHAVPTTLTARVPTAPRALIYTPIVWQLKDVSARVIISKGMGTQMDEQQKKNSHELICRTLRRPPIERNKK